nr:MAG TPA: Transcription initiation factor IIE, alpha FINGER, Transcription [Caudoviricetes sp.]
MTPTSDERREVAARLRETKTECEKRGYPWMVEDLMQALGFGTYEDGDEGIFDRLAGLIDPTCHNQHPRASDGCFCCSECLFLYEPTDWSACRNSFLYCPRCGARVVRGGED